MLPERCGHSSVVDKLQFNFRSHVRKDRGERTADWERNLWPLIDAQCREPSLRRAEPPPRDRFGGRDRIIHPS